MTLFAYCQDILTESLYQQAENGKEFVAPGHLAAIVSHEWLASNQEELTNDEICLNRLLDWFNEIIRVRPENDVIYESVASYLVHCIKDTIFYLVSEAWVNGIEENCSSDDTHSSISDGSLSPLKLDMDTASVLIEEVKKVSPFVA